MCEKKPIIHRAQSAYCVHVLITCIIIIIVLFIYSEKSAL